MPTEEDAKREVKKIRTKEKLLGLVIAAIPIAAAICYFVFLKNKASSPLLWVLIGLEWLVLALVYLMLMAKMRPRRR